LILIRINAFLSCPVMQALLGLSGTVVPFASSANLPDTANLTEMQRMEVDNMTELIRERTGRDLPKLVASPNEPSTLVRSHAGATEPLMQP
jgi:hypothetical protein